MNTLNQKQQKLLKRFQSPLAIKFFFLRFIPSLFFWNARILQINSSESIVSVPYNWRTKNPFRSIYFGTQAGAAELSSGILVLLATHSFNVSALVIGIEGQFYKKATRISKFHCEDGDKIFETVKRAITTGEPQIVTITSKGVQQNGEVVSEFKISWSFKRRN